MKEIVGKGTLKIWFLFMVICALAMSMASPELAQGNGTASTQTPLVQTWPTITSVSPNQGSQGQTLSVTVVGTNFIGATRVSFGKGIDVTSFTVTSATQITANIVIADRAFVGSRFITVTAPSGKGTIPAGFTFDAPTMTSVSPNQGSQGQN